MIWHDEYKSSWENLPKKVQEEIEEREYPLVSSAINTRKDIGSSGIVAAVKNVIERIVHIKRNGTP